MRGRIWLHWICLVALVALAGCKPKGPPPITTVNLKVTSTPAGAQVLVDDDLAGVTPFEGEVTVDRHMLEVRLPGYETEWRPLPANPTHNHVFDLTLRPICAAVHVDSVPSGALLKLDGADKGAAPQVLMEVPVGQHELLFSLNGYADKRIALNIEDARPQRIREELESVMAQLEVVTELPGVDIYVGDKLRGTTGMDGAALRIGDLLAGEYVVTAKKPGYQELAQNVVLPRNGSKTLRFEAMKELPGSVKITSDPAGAKVHNAGGELLGVTPLTVANLPNGEATFTISKAGYLGVERSVTVSRGLVKQIDVTLTSNTGAVSFMTEPAGFKYYLDGRELGTTAPADNPLVSREVTHDGLVPGPHRIDLVNPEFESFSRAFQVERDKTTRLGTLRPKKRWLPTHELKTTAGPVYRGILVTRYPDGSILFERAPNIRVTYKADEIKSVAKLEGEEP